MIPSVGRLVHLRLSDQCAAQVNRARAAHADTDDVSNVAATGAVIRKGNPVRGGDIFPLLITHVWADEAHEGTAVNGQVFLDGNDCLWVTSVQQGDGPGQWFEPPRV